MVVATNTGPHRAGSVTIAGRSIPVNQNTGCTYSVKPDSLRPEAAGLTTGIDVTTNAGCPVSATSSAGWVRLGSFQPTGTVRIPVTVNANGGRNKRIAVVTITGDTFIQFVSVEQDGR
jgi:hypothetical protein